MSNITKRELELLKIIWRKGESTTREILEEEEENKNISYIAIKSMLDLMIKKEILKRRKIGPTYLYTANIDKKQIIIDRFKTEIGSLVDGMIVPLFKFMAKEYDLTQEEIEKLRKIIDDIKE
ncbi:MAG: BlaI/MecI/CopY family transcriptional regulator [Candidatus Latescibacteria bacterium]|nr:BlaI/MecI/CopY family transcriptional regulator [Candidatus Latescibacterota bacterium]